MLDTTIPGHDAGSLNDGRFDWIEAELARGRQTPTVLAMHHPPLLTGVRAWDDYVLPVADQRALGDLVARHRQVRRVLAGHLHRAMTAELGACPVVAVPSTYVQARLDLATEKVDFSDGTPAFAVHSFHDGRLISHLQPVAGRRR